ncbi:MAG TPA: branched-chain amino acid ABC transporter permease [Candidatus Paceibacterota bacterium]
MGYIIHLIILCLLFAINAMSLNLLIGYTGLLFAASAAFAGIGAYTTVFLLKSTELGFFPAVIISMLVASVMATLLGLVLNKFRDDYFALVSVGFQVIVSTVFMYWVGFTRGPLGIPGIARPTLLGLDFSSNIMFLILVAIIASVVYLFIKFLIGSPFGRVLKAIRDNEEAIKVFGYNTYFFKLTILSLAAMLCALAGALYASYITYISPPVFYLFESILLISIVTFGGLGSLKGPVIGAVIMVLLPEALRFVGFPPEVAAQMRQAVFGLALILLMLYRPQGLVGEYKL